MLAPYSGKVVVHMPVDPSAAQHQTHMLLEHGSRRLNRPLAEQNAYLIAWPDHQLPEKLPHLPETAQADPVIPSHGTLLTKLQHADAKVRLACTNSHIAVLYVRNIGM